MNEKKCFIFVFICIVLFSFSGCCTRSGIHNHGNGAYSVRENLRELGEEQTQSALTSAELKSGIEKSLEQVGELERTITDGEGDVEDFKAILRRIRERSGGGDSGKGSGDNEAEREKSHSFKAHYYSFFDIANSGNYRCFFAFHKAENGIFKKVLK